MQTPTDEMERTKQEKREREREREIPCADKGIKLQRKNK